MLTLRSQALPCMTAECTATFPPATYPSFLALRMIESLASIAQQADLDIAFDGVEGFEKCPCVLSFSRLARELMQLPKRSFCPYACYIENPQERLLRCERAECQKVTCRQCKKVRLFLSLLASPRLWRHSSPLAHAWPLTRSWYTQESHLPLTCKEADKDSRLAGVHAVAGESSLSGAATALCTDCARALVGNSTTGWLADAPGLLWAACTEAMSAALIRPCPTCQTPATKLDGCNKMTCPQCHTFYCYVCRQKVRARYVSGLGVC